MPPRRPPRRPGPRNRPPERYDINTEGDDGRAYSGTYTLTGSGPTALVEVISEFGTTDGKPLGRSPADQVAERILGELVRQQLHRQKRDRNTEDT